MSQSVRSSAVPIEPIHCPFPSEPSEESYRLRRNLHAESLSSHTLPRLRSLSWPLTSRDLRLTLCQPQKFPVKRHRRPAQRPNCTHLTMERIHGPFKCNICNQHSSMGWLYVCTQDDPMDDYEMSCMAGGGDDVFMMDLVEAGISTSVIRTIKEGGYTPQQLERLKEQKQHLKSAIAALEEEEAAKERDVNTLIDNFLESNTGLLGGFRDINGINRDEGRKARDKIDEAVRPKPRPKTCTFQCCHPCRPYYENRIYMAIDAVVNGYVSPLTLEEAHTLPISNASILRNIGLRNETPTSVGQTMSFGTNSSLNTPSTVAAHQSGMTYHKGLAGKLTRRYSDPVREMEDLEKQENSALVSITQVNRLTPLKLALKRAFQFGRKAMFKGESSITLPLPQTGVLREMDDTPTEFDIGSMKRSLEGQGMGPRYPVTTTVADAEDTTPEGDEVDVGGGVALTEEALQTNIPDVITQA